MALVMGDGVGNRDTRGPKDLVRVTRDRDTEGRVTGVPVGYRDG